jgi:hypothetical protein
MARLDEATSVKIVDGYKSIHPALDFWEDKAIVSVGVQLEKTKLTNGSIDFADGEYTILSNGDNFIYSKNKLAEYKLYYARGMDLPLGRWEYSNIVSFCEGINNGNKPTVDIAILYKVIRDTWDYYMDFCEDVYYDVLTAFTIYTYFFPLFNSAPILQLWGEYSTGKSKICKLLEAMCFNPVYSANISSASVFRIVEASRSIILFDESEDLMTSERGKEICNLLLAGYSKGGTTYRQEKQANDKFKTASFKVFSPKVIANIKGINLAPLLTRTIRLTTTGASNKTKANREDIEIDDVVFQELRNSLYRSLLLHYSSMRRLKDELPDVKLSDRSLAIWQGILTIVHACNPEKWTSVRDFSYVNTTSMKEELETQNTGVALLKTLKNLTDRFGDDFYPCKKLFEMLFSDENLGITSMRDLGVMMRRVGFTESKVQWTSGGPTRGYQIEQKWIDDRLSRL